MPQVVVDLTSSAIGDRVAAFAVCEKGTLTTIGALVPSQDSEPNTIYARLSIVDSAPQSPKIVAPLTAGYIGGGQTISWTGAIELYPTCAVMIETWGNAIVRCRLTGVITLPAPA